MEHPSGSWILGHHAIHRLDDGDFDRGSLLGLAVGATRARLQIPRDGGGGGRGVLIASLVIVVMPVLGVSDYPRDPRLVRADALTGGPAEDRGPLRGAAQLQLRQVGVVITVILVVAKGGRLADQA